MSFAPFPMRMPMRAAFSLGVAAALSACATSKPFGGDPGLKLQSTAEMPVPTRDETVADFESYHVSPNDTLEIGVFGIKELEPREVRLDSGGRLSFPLAGSIDAGGMTLSELEAELARRLSAAYVRNPQVTVNLKKTVDRLVTVDGQVMKPGSYPVIGKMSLIRAVAVAGSTTEYAKLHDVVVFREVAGQRYAALYNLDAIRRGAYPDPAIYAGDVVVVGDSKARRMFKDFLQIVPLLSSPLILLLQ